MVIIEYPIDEHGNAVVGSGRNVEARFRPVPYPDLRVKRREFTAGWWEVYIKLRTSEEGQVEKREILRPETSGPREKVFLDQVTREMARWSYGRGPSEIHVDVRFYVE